MTPKQGQLTHESPPPARFCDVTSAGGGGSRRWSSSMASLGTDDDPDSFGLGMRRGRTSNHVSMSMLDARETWRSTRQDIDVRSRNSYKCGCSHLGMFYVPRKSVCAAVSSCPQTSVTRHRRLSDPGSFRLFGVSAFATRSLLDDSPV